MKPKVHDRHSVFIVMMFLAVILTAFPSCMKDAPETLPETFRWNPEMAFPIGDASFGMNMESGFDTLLLEPDPLTGWPEWVNEAEINIQGTMDFDLSSISENLDHLNRILFRVNLFNGFPERLHAQAYFIDGENNPVDSLFAAGPMVVPPGTVQGSGETILPAHEQQDALFERDRLEPLQAAVKILMRATILNPGPDTALIPCYPSYHFDVRIGGMIDVTIQF